MHARFRLLACLLGAASVCDTACQAEAPAAEELVVPAGFRVELLRSARPGEGSWVCLAVDPRGRLYLSPQDPKQPILRVTLDAGGQVAAIEPVPLPVSGAMGMLWAFDSLYVSGAGPEGQGIYRLRDSDGDGDLDRATLFKAVTGGAGEHGAHALVQGPDEHLYIVHGDSTPIVDGIDPRSPCRHAAEDDVLPRLNDPAATFFDHLKSPYGHILRTDPDGREWQLWATGLHNAHDIDFNADGELFTYESDMERDVGLPWYRPTRILHLVPGGEYGFREGAAKIAADAPDTLPSVVDVGLGSPTGVKFGTRSNWPETWKSAFYVMDWTYGRILAVHLHPEGAGYGGRFEDFVKGEGLPVTDLEFGADGAMYFTVGGRSTQGGLYRVSATDEVKAPGGPPEPTTESLDQAAAMRAERRRLESRIGRQDAEALEIAWPFLGDPQFGYAARLVIESQPVEAWRDRALSETDPEAGLAALLALARVGTDGDRRAVVPAVAALVEAAPVEPSRGRKVVSFEAKALRVAAVAVARGIGAEALDAAVLGSAGRLEWRDFSELSRMRTLAPYEAAIESQWRRHREAAALRVALGDAHVVEPLLELMEAAHGRWIGADKPVPDPMHRGPQEESIWYARALCEVPAAHFSPAQRERYFAWFGHARAFRGANSFVKYLKAIRDRALARLDDAERSRMAAVIEAATP